MPDYFRREVTTRRVEYVVPMNHPDGICWAEIMKAIRACHTELWDQGRVPHGQDASDDTITLVPGDEDIVVRFLLKEEVASDGR